MITIIDMCLALFLGSIGLIYLIIEESDRKVLEKKEEESLRAIQKWEKSKYD